MTIYLVRHGKDDDNFRGGWSGRALTEEGVEQVHALALELINNKEKYNISKIYSSDLFRTKQTSEIISNALEIDVEYLSEFREINNGDLAGMENKIADMKYPNLYYRGLEWEEHYPNGESPKEFYERIYRAWNMLINSVDENIMLVTHGGVINIIRCIVKGEQYSNQNRYEGVPCAKLIAINI